MHGKGPVYKLVVTTWRKLFYLLRQNYTRGEFLGVCSSFTTILLLLSWSKETTMKKKEKTFLSSSRFCSSQETLNVTKKQNWHQPWLYDIHLQGVPKKNVLTFG